MKRKKFLSIIVSFILVFSFAFTNLSNAATTQTLPYSPTSSVSSGDYMYYAIYEKIYKVNTSTKKTTLVKSIGRKWVYNLTVSNGWIYLTVNDGGTGAEFRPSIYKVRTNGKDYQKLATGYDPVVYNGKIYYIKIDFKNCSEYDYNTIGIYRMSTSGSSQKCIKKSSTALEFAVYKSNIYYTTYSSSSEKYYLRKTNLSGTTSKVMTTSSSGISNLKAYSDYIYFDLEQYDTSIYRIKTTSTTRSSFVKNASIRDISNGYVYYVVNNNYETYKLYKIKISSLAKTRLMTNEGSIADVYVSKSSMLVTYYVDDYYANARTSIFNTSGKNKTVLNKFFVS